MQEKKCHSGLPCRPPHPPHSEFPYHPNPGEEAG